MIDHHSIASEIFAVTAPVYVLVFVGMFLKRTRMINENFIKIASNIVYKVSMPVLFYLSMAGADLSKDVDYGLLAYYAFAVICIIVVASVIAYLWIGKEKQAVFVQGVFRGNYGIISLALAINLFGDEGLGLAATLVAVGTIINNGLSPVVFAIFPTEYKLSPAQLMKEIFLSPMIIGVILGIISSVSGVHLPVGIDKAAVQLGSLTLPLALICIGASLSFRSLRAAGAVTINTALGKLVWGALLFVPLGFYWLELSALEVGMLFIFLSTPTAAVSYVLAEVAGADSKLAANIVVLTTFASLFIISTGLYLINLLGWM